MAKNKNKMQEAVARFQEVCYLDSKLERAEGRLNEQVSRLTLRERLEYAKRTELWLVEREKRAMVLLAMRAEHWYEHGGKEEIEGNAKWHVRSSN